MKYDNIKSVAVKLILAEVTIVEMANNIKFIIRLNIYAAYY